MEIVDILRNKYIHLNQLLANNLQQGKLEEVRSLEIQIEETLNQIKSLELGNQTADQPDTEENL